MCRNSLHDRQTEAVSMDKTTNKKHAAITDPGACVSYGGQRVTRRRAQMYAVFSRHSGVCCRAGRFPGILERAVIGSRAGGAVAAGTKGKSLREQGKGTGTRRARVGEHVTILFQQNGCSLCSFAS